MESKEKWREQKIQHHQEPEGGHGKGGEFRDKLVSILKLLWNELVKMTFIGKKMLKATDTNNKLHLAYEELGHLASEAIRKGDLHWENPKALELMKTIEDCHHGLKACEDDVKNIKQQNSPVEKQNGRPEAAKEEVKRERNFRSKEL